MMITKAARKKRIQKWVDALVSRKYKKTCGSLVNIYGHWDNDSGDFIGTEEMHCVLGVGACLMPNRNHIIDFEDYSAIRNYYGLSLEDEENLINMNDDKDYKFYQMARWLRRKFLGEK